MVTNDKLDSAYQSLDQADETVRQLHDACCQPNRSPRMEALAATLQSARSELARIEENHEAGEAALRILENAGSQLGWLQVGCCAPGRMSLYAQTLESLSKAQRIITRALDSGGH